MLSWLSESKRFPPPGLRGERAAWLKNSPTVESFQTNLKTYLFCERLSGAISSNVCHRIVFVSLYYMFTRLDYSSALEYSNIRRCTNIVYYYYYYI